eukprot:c11294_g1_i2.p1 GENE.c11294_g1_i2~~c11294_g1_i2.p1  ORF type:complete len:132 (-),score=19.60 c11294_g1_i2:23-418(-)
MRIEWCCCCLSVRQGVLILIVSQAFFSGVSLLNSSVARSVLLGPPSSSLTSWFAEGEVNLCFNAIAFLGALLGIYGESESAKMVIVIPVFVLRYHLLFAFVRLFVCCTQTFICPQIYAWIWKHKHFDTSTT